LSDQNPRQIAARVLSQRLNSSEFTENLLETALANARLSPVDRSLCHELVCGVVRWQATLDCLIARKTTSGREPRPALINLLRLGLYQIFWLDRIPPHAAVHETVELAKRSGYVSQSGFINAILRGYLREFDEVKKILADMKISQPALGWSHPEWLVEKWRKNFGDEKTRQLLEWNNTPPKNFARVNTLARERRRLAGEFQRGETPAGSQRSQDAGDLLTRWRDEGVEYDFVHHDWLEENLVFELKSHPPLASLGSFRDDWFYIQDPGTLLAPVLLGAQPGETILDLCAAPGGKATFIAQLMEDTGKIVAQDISEERLKLIRENCVRLGVTCVETQISEFIRPHPGPLPQEREQPLAASVSSSALVANPATKTRQPFPPLPRGEGRGEGGRKHISFFDRILVDAPCSNTGVLRRRVDLRWRISADEISRLKKTQLELLNQAATKLKPGGVLVYSTCSLEPEENSEVVKEFLAANANFKLESERQLLPFADDVDGAYVARLRLST
jgi:16S rRNA (cytosine967-C5)-methyltransferase